MTQKLASLSIELSANVAKFESDLGRAARMAKKESDKMKRQFQVMAKAVVASSVSAVAGIGAIVKSTANAADNIQKMSNRLGVSTKFLSEYRHVAELSGTSLDKVGEGVRKMSKSINDANNGLSTANRAFESLGISLDELNSLSPEKQFELIADRLSKVESQSVKAGASMDIFGRSGSELLTVINAGADGIKSMRDEAQKFGLTISQDAADAAANFNDELTRLESRMTGLKEQIGQQLMPAVTEIINQFNSGDVAQADSNWQGLQTTLATTYGAVLLIDGAFETVGRAAGLMAVKAVQAFKLIGQTAKGLFARLQRGNQIIIDTFTGDFTKSNKMAANVHEIESAYSDLIKTLASTTEIKGFSDDVSKSFQEMYDKINKVNDANIQNTKEFKKSDSQVKKTTKLFNSLGDGIGYTESELKSLNKQFESIADRFLTPLEQIKKEYHENIVAVDEWLSAQEDFDKAVITAANLTNKLTKERDDNIKALEANKKSLESQLTPYEELIKSMENELMLLGKKGADLNNAIAIQDLARAGITVAAVGQDEYNSKLEEYLGLLEQINAQNGVFGNGINDFKDLLSSSLTNGNFFSDMANGFDAMTSSAENFAQGLQSIGQFAQFAIDSFESHSGKDDIGQSLATINDIASSGALGPVAQAISQVATFIDTISGGRLFGTDYELESAQTNINIGATGTSGTQSQTNVRQRSLFRGRQWQTITEDINQAGLDAINAFYDGLIVGIEDLSRNFGVKVPQLITGAFEQNFDENGDLVSEFSTILGRTWNETLEQFQLRLASENFIAVGDLGLGGGNEISSFAERFRSSAESLSEFAEFAINAVSRIQSGDGLLGSFTAIASIVEELSHSNETLLQTHQRIIGSVDLLNNSLDNMGISLITNEEHFIRFATSITDAAGGLEQAQSLWNSYFNTFYDANELINTQLSGATAIRDSLIGGLGVQGLGIDNFREMFESVLPSLSADAIVQWLEAAEAIGVVIDLEGQLAQQRQELTSIIDNIRESMITDEMSEFELAMRSIQSNLDEQIATAIRLGATEKELAMIRRFADRQIQNTIREYEQLAQSLAADLYGTASENLINGIESQLNGINEQISLLEQQQSAAQQAAQAAIQAYEAQQAALENIVDFAESLLTGQFSPLNPAEQLAIAQQQFNQALSAAQGGDLGALGNLQGLAQTLLGLSQTNFASGQANTDIFNQVYEALSGLGIGLGQGAPSTSVGVPAGLSALYEQQAQLNQQLADAQRAADEATSLLQQQRLFDMLTELSEAQNVSIQVLAERLGIPLDRLVADLGVKLVDISTSLSKPLQIDTSTIETAGDTLVADTISTESGETQEEIRNLKEEVSGLRSDIRDFLAEVAA